MYDNSFCIILPLLGIEPVRRQCLAMQCQLRYLLSLSEPGKDFNELGNWRPISLLNIDHKIATKAFIIANRIKKCSHTSLVKNRHAFKRKIYWGKCTTNI